MEKLYKVAYDKTSIAYVVAESIEEAARKMNRDSQFEYEHPKIKSIELFAAERESENLLII